MADSSNISDSSVSESSQQRKRVEYQRYKRQQKKQRRSSGGVSSVSHSSGISQLKSQRCRLLRRQKRQNVPRSNDDRLKQPSPELLRIYKAEEAGQDIARFQELDTLSLTIGVPISHADRATEMRVLELAFDERMRMEGGILERRQRLKTPLTAEGIKQECIVWQQEEDWLARHATQSNKTMRTGQMAFWIGKKDKALTVYTKEIRDERRKSL
jgi:hypothetical protein